MTDSSKWVATFAESVEFNDSNDPMRWTVAGQPLTPATLARLRSLTKADCDEALTPLERGVLARYRAASNVVLSFLAREGGSTDTTTVRDAVAAMPPHWIDQFEAALKLRDETPDDAA